MNMSKNYMHEKKQQIGNDLLQGKLSKTQQDKAFKLYHEINSGLNAT